MTLNPAHPPAAPRLGRYDIDTRRSTVTFTTRHLFGLAPVRGTFTVHTGTVDITEPITDATVHAEIDAASFHTGNPHRDATVRSPRYLDTDRYPTITFTSTAWHGTTHTGTPTGTHTGTLTGTLTVRDVTHPVSLTVDQPSMHADTFTVHATTRIDRTAFGVTTARGIAGRYLTVTLKIRCVRK